MTPAELHAALVPHFEKEIEQFKNTFTKARLRTFIIQKKLVLELVPKASVLKRLNTCSQCLAKAEWWQVSTVHVIPYCERHHPKPRHAN